MTPATGTQDAGASMAAEIAAVVSAFGVSDGVSTIERMEGGHIHRTWSVDVGAERFVCQALNERVFADLVACEENLRRIDDHFRGQDAVLVPTLRRTAAGLVHHRSPAGTMSAVPRQSCSVAWSSMDFSRVSSGTMVGW